MDVFINLTRNSFGGQESVRFILKVKRWGETECLLWFCFVEWEAETLLETGVFSHCSRGWFDRGDFLQNTDILHTPPSSSYLQLFWPLRVSHNSRTKEKRKKKRGGGGGTRHKAWVFNTSFQTLLAGLILLLFRLLWYFLSSFMDPWGLFTCDITETLSSQDCVYPVQTSLIVFYLLQESNTPKSLVVFRLPLTCLGVPIQGKCAKAKTASA